MKFTIMSLPKFLLAIPQLFVPSNFTKRCICKKNKYLKPTNTKPTMDTKNWIAKNIYAAVFFIAAMVLLPMQGAAKKMSSPAALENVQVVICGVKTQNRVFSSLLERLTTAKDSVFYLFKNSGNADDFNQYHKSIADSVVRFVFQHYDAIKNADTTVSSTYVEDHILCFERFVHAYHQLTEVANKMKQVEEEYTSTVWNPYLFIEMEEIRKERIFRAYKTTILPYLKNALLDQITCSKVDYLGSEFIVLYDKMIWLRNTATKSLEKKLKKTNDTASIIQLFELPF